MAGRRRPLLLELIINRDPWILASLTLLVVGILIFGYGIFFMS
jgi:hypothetical protein